MNSTKTVSITGAAGQIGYALIFRIASGELFGSSTPVRLRLIELERSLPALEGVRMELDDCAFPLLEEVVTTSDVNIGFSGTDWAILVGSVPRKAGMERKDLLEINGKIFVDQGKAIQENASPDVRVLVVGNPCNTNCLIARAHAPKLPERHFFAMTALDENRAKHQLAHKANVSLAEIQNMTIWGNHSSTQYPDFENARILEKLAPDVITNRSWLENDFLTTIQQRGAKIIEARGASSAASAANAILDSVRRIETPTPEGESFSMGVLSRGEYGVPEGLVCSFPLQSTGGEIQVVEGLSMSPFGEGRFRTSIDELVQEREMVKALL
ncbi:malate dehydrogenase [Candidatus Peregrinibacteria bacterium]|nr:MAG: malate dehydrogenase [Candidatus Peregrinibacteria bacterium]